MCKNSFTPMKLVESQSMHKSHNTPPVHFTAPVSFLVAVILMFIGISAVHAQEADTTAAVQDTTLMLDESVMDEEVVDDPIIDTFEADTTVVDTAQTLDESVMDEEVIDDPVIDTFEADTTVVDTVDLFDAVLDTAFQDTATDESMFFEADSVFMDSLVVEDSDTVQTYELFTPPPEPVYSGPEDMVWISAGKLPDPLRKFREEELEVAWTNGFYMDEHEVTNEEFANFLSSDFENAIFFDERMYITQVVEGVFVADEGRETMPVTFVNWFGAFAYAQWAGKSLPTEEEWILACFGIYTNEDLTKWYPWGQADPETIQANLLDASRIGAPKATMTYPTSMTATGLYDMAGNVAEWTLTNFTLTKAVDDDAEYENPTLVSQQIVESDTTASDTTAVIAAPEEDVDMSLRFVIKGGSYLDPPSNVQLNRRATRFPHERYQYVGFRCVMREGNR